MSKYTTQVRWIVENHTQKLQGFPISERVGEATSKIFNFHYPIWSEDYRRTLEKKILMHYFTKEIGFETVELWKFYLEERMNLIMPYYNELYKTIAKEYDWLTNYDYSESYLGKRNSNEVGSQIGKNDSEAATTDHNTTDTNYDSEVNNTHSNQVVTDSTNKVLKSDLPQATYHGVDYGTNLDEDEGKTNVDDSGKNDIGTVGKSSTRSDGNSTANSSLETKLNTDKTNKADEEYTRKLKGYQGKSPTELMLEYRQSLLNIDMMVVGELKDLFMMIW